MKNKEFPIDVTCCYTVQCEQPRQTKHWEDHFTSHLVFVMTEQGGTRYSDSLTVINLQIVMTWFSSQHSNIYMQDLHVFLDVSPSHYPVIISEKPPVVKYMSPAPFLCVRYFSGVCPEFLLRRKLKLCKRSLTGSRFRSFPVKIPGIDSGERKIICLTLNTSAGLWPG